MRKIEKYISIVFIFNKKSRNIEVENIKSIIIPFEQEFSFVETIIVNNSSEIIPQDFLNITKNISIINLSNQHSFENSLSAGIDACIGDFIYEIHDVIHGVDYFENFKAMFKYVEEGNDFVFLNRKKKSLLIKINSLLIRNHYKHLSKESINESIVVITSRRGINKVSSIGEVIVNRQLLYLLSGLKYKVLAADFTLSPKRTKDKLHLILDTSVFYTNVFSTILLLFAVIIAVTSLFIFAVSFNNSAQLYLLLVMSLSISFILFITAIVMKYLHHILNKSIGMKKYIFSSIEKK